MAPSQSQQAPENETPDFSQDLYGNMSTDDVQTKGAQAVTEADVGKRVAVRNLWGSLRLSGS